LYFGALKLLYSRAIIPYIRIIVKENCDFFTKQNEKTAGKCKRNESNITHWIKNGKMQGDKSKNQQTVKIARNKPVCKAFVQHRQKV